MTKTKNTVLDQLHSIISSNNIVEVLTFGKKSEKEYIVYLTKNISAKKRKLIPSEIDGAKITVTVSGKAMPAKKK